MTDKSEAPAFKADEEIFIMRVRVPDEATITASQLAEAFGSDAADVPDQVWARLEALAPGITAHVRIVSF